MDDIIEHSGESGFANGQSSRDLRENPGAAPHDEDLRDRTDSSDGLQALRKDSDEDLERRVELRRLGAGDYGTSGRGPWSRRISKRVVLVALLVPALGAVSPFAWNYLQSYESTDHAQIDGSRRATSPTARRSSSALKPESMR